MLVLRPEKLLSKGEAVAVQAVAEIALRCGRRQISCSNSPGYRSRRQALSGQMTQDDDARLRQSGDHNGVQDLAWVANAPLRQ
jgi:hypothetical protein